MAAQISLQEKRFRFERSLEHGLLGDPNADFACSFNLSNHIHPLFAPERFINLTGEQLNAIKPALQLASNLLTVPTSKDFWVRLTQGQMIQHMVTKRHSIFCGLETNNETFGKADRILKEASKYIFYTFGEERGRCGQAEGATASINAHRDADFVQKHLSKVKLPTEIPSFIPTQYRDQFAQLVFITLNPIYMAYLAHYVQSNGKSGRSKAERARALFCLAITMVHETVHAIENLVHLFRSPVFIHLCLTSSSRWAELGYEWEKTAFPFHMFAMRLGKVRVIPITGIHAVKWESFTYTEQTKQAGYLETACAEAIPMSWVEKFFQDQFWNNILNSDQWRAAMRFTSTLSCMRPKGRPWLFIEDDAGPYSLRKLIQNPDVKKSIELRYPELLQ